MTYIPTYHNFASTAETKERQRAMAAWEKLPKEEKAKWITFGAFLEDRKNETRK